MEAVIFIAIGVVLLILGIVLGPADDKTPYDPVPEDYPEPDSADFGPEFWGDDDWPEYDNLRTE